MDQLSIPNMIMLGLAIILQLLLVVKLLRNVLAPVIDKHTVSFFSKYSGSQKNTRYVVVFSSGGKKLSFYVSSFSYGGYHKGETGMLKYKGGRIIDFH